MKRILLPTLFLLIATVSFAQTPKPVPDSLKYALKKFELGRVTFNDGRVVQGEFNYSYLDQVIRFKENGKVMALSDNAYVTKLSAGGKLFTRYKNGFIETVDFIGAVSLCVLKEVSVIKEELAGAYGFTDQASFNKEVNMRNMDARVQDMVQTYDLEQELVLPYKYSETYYLMNGNRVFPATAQSFKKVFSSEKSKVEQYLQEHNVDFSSFSDISAFFTFMKQ